MVEHFPEEPTLGLFLNALDVGVLIIDQTGTVVWANDKLYQLADLTPDQLVGLKTKEMAKLPAIQASVNPQWVQDSFWEAARESGCLADSTQPRYGYAQMENGVQLLSAEHYIRNETGGLRYIVLTVQASTDLLTAREKIGELEQRTALYQEQLSALHTRVLGQDIVYQSESLSRVFERALRLARLEGKYLLDRRDWCRQKPFSPVHPCHEPALQRLPLFTSIAPVCPPH